MRAPRRSAAAMVDVREPWHLRRSARQRSRFETYGAVIDTVDEKILSFIAPGSLELYRKIYADFLRGAADFGSRLEP